MTPAGLYSRILAGFRVTVTVGPSHCPSTTLPHNPDIQPRYCLGQGRIGVEVRN